MRILMLRQYFAPPGSPGSYRPMELASRWQKAGNDVVILTSNARFPAPESTSRKTQQFKYDGVTVVALPVSYGQEFSTARRIFSFMKFAALSTWTLFRMDRPDVIFASSTPLTVALPALLHSVLRGLPMVFEVRDLWPDLPIRMGALKNPVFIMAARILERATYWRSRKIVALSPGMKDEIVKSGISPEKIVVGSNTSNLQLFATPDQEQIRKFSHKRRFLSGRPFLLYAGSLGPLHQPNWLTSLAAELDRVQPDIGILVIGNGSESQEMLNAARRQGVLEKNLFFEKAIPKTYLPVAYETCVAAFSLTMDDPIMATNSANKFFDTLAAGKPILINYGGWQADLINRTGCGLVLNRHDPHEAARQIAGLIDDDDRLRRTGLKARELAENHFSADKIADKILLALADSNNP